MKKLLILAALVAVVAVFAPRAWEKVKQVYVEDEVRQRVDRLLSGMAEDPPDEQLAMAAWYRDSLILTEDEMRGYYDEWNAFWRSSGLAERRDWQIVELTRSEAGWLVTVSGGGARPVLLVPDRGPIELR